MRALFFPRGHGGSGAERSEASKGGRPAHLILIVLLAFLTFTQPASAAPQRVVSASLCADQYVLPLAQRGQIAALSWQSRDKLSLVPDWARRLPQAAPDAERLLMLKPDLVVFGPGEGGRAQQMLERFGIATHEITWTETLDGVEANITGLAAVLERDKAGVDLNARLESRRSALTQRTAARQGKPGLLYLTPAGGGAGGGTYVDEAIRLAGGRNLMADRSGWFTVRPEALRAIEPDLVVASYFRDGYESQQYRRARHPVMQRILSRERVEIPGGFWPCAGPRLMDAAERIGDGLDMQASGR